MTKRLLIILACLAVLIPSSAQTWNVLTVSGGAGAAPPAEYEISDDFSSDTTANYTQTNTEDVGTLSISGGKAHESASYKKYTGFHETALSSPSHYAQAKIMPGVGCSDYSAIMARHSGQTGANESCYLVRMANEGSCTTIYLYRLVAGASWPGSYLGEYEGTYTGGTEYTVKLAVSGTGATVTVGVYVNDTLRIGYEDTNAARLTTGNYIGIGLLDTSDGTDITVDDLIGDAL